MTHALISLLTAAPARFPTPPPPTAPPFMAGFLQVALWVGLGAAVLGIIMVAWGVVIRGRGSSGWPHALAGGMTKVGALMILAGGSVGGLIAVTSTA